MAPYEAYKVEWERTAGDWRDITSYVEHLELVRVRASGSDTSEPSTGTLTLNNADHRFTPGNTTSPEYPYWRQARRVRCRETIGNRSFDTCLMWTQPAEVEDWVASGDQSITVPLVDALSRLESARTFVSTLAEHIRFNAGGVLKVHWPFGDPAVPFRDISGNNQTPVTPVSTGLNQNSFITAYSGLAAIVPNGGEPLPGDDLVPVRIELTQSTWSVVTNPVIASSWKLRPTLRPPIALPDNQVATFVAWTNRYAGPSGGLNNMLGLVVDETGPTGQAGVSMDRANDEGAPPLGVMEADLSAGALSASIVSTAYGTWDRWQPVALRYGANPKVFELWVDEQVFTAAPAGTSPATSTISGAWPVNVDWGGDLAHVQLYVGPPSAWDHDDFLTQRRMGLYGLARQRTDERIRLIAKYAGLTDADLLLDVGVAVMGQASLAGQSPEVLMRAAADTERGRLFVDGSGRVVFHNRTRTYNI